MLKRHILLMNIAMISTLVVMVLGVVAGIVLAVTLDLMFMLAAVSAGSIVVYLPTFFILRWFKKDYTELADNVKILTSRLNKVIKAQQND